MEKPLAVVIVAVLNNNKILLIKRNKGDYSGLFGLPGGKIEKKEHLSEAATRELLEEAGIETEFKDYLALVSEHLVENKEIIQHFLLHVCELEPKTTKIKQGPEGELSWFDLGNISNLKDKIIPSDFLIIEKIIKNKNNAKNYYSCVMEKRGKEYALIKFE